MAGNSTFGTSSSSSSLCLRSSSSSGAAATLSLSSNKPFILPMRLSTPKFTPLGHKFTKILSFTSNDIKVGAKFLHVKPGNGAAFVRAKIRNYITGSTVEKTFRAGISITYEEIRWNDSDVGDENKWLKEGMDHVMHFWKGNLANLPHLLSFNISHNQLQGELPAGRFFNTISLSSVLGNPALCGCIVDRSFPAVLPKPVIFNPNSSSNTAEPGSISQTYAIGVECLGYNGVRSVDFSDNLLVGEIADGI
ncbi:hypothetical protein MKX03_027064 [Papaver bracteatum]|nr:hypothetical protein MKX03_027064 [Papaver bracteatum]